MQTTQATVHDLRATAAKHGITAYKVGLYCEKRGWCSRPLVTRVLCPGQRVRDFRYSSLAYITTALQALIADPKAHKAPLTTTNKETTNA